MSEHMILVGHGPKGSILGDRWTAWAEKSWDEVLAAVADRARDGKASSGGFEVIEVTVTRRAAIRPIISTVEVDES